MPALSRSRAITVALAFLIICPLALTYASSLPNDFVTWDDDWRVYDNPYIRGFSSANLKETFTNTDPRYWPLTSLLFQLVYTLAGLNPIAYHLASLLLHASNALLAWWFFHQFTGRRWLAFYISLLFALHPLQVEAVAWVSNTNNILATLFCLLALIGYLYYQKLFSWRYFALSLLAFLLALLASPIAVSLPLVLLLIDFSHRRPFNKRTLVEKIPFFGLSIIFTAITFIGAESDLSSRLPLVSRIPLTAKSLIFSAGQLFFPHHLSAIYPSPESFNLATDVIFPPVALIIIASLVLFTLQWGRGIVFGSAFFLVTILPPLWLIASQKISIFATDRYSYIPALGLFYVISLTASFVYQRVTIVSPVKQCFAAALLISVCFLLATYSYQRSQVWQNSETLYLDVLRKYPRSIQAHQNLGDLYRLSGRYDEALAQYKQVLTLQSGHSEALNAIGIVYLNTNRLDEAAVAFLQSAVSDPENMNPRNNLTTLYLEQGQTEPATAQAQAVLAKDPANVVAHINQANIYLQQGHIDPAKTEVAAALNLNPHSASAHNTLGQIYMLQGQYQEAQAEYELFLAFDPDNTLAHNNLGTAYAKQGLFGQAREEYEAALQLNPNDPQALQNLGILNQIIR